jgi:hypothetical protein
MIMDDPPMKMTLVALVLHFGRIVAKRGSDDDLKEGV